eukprot:1325791-Amorphochlora_amoeboformis.AAC.2
MRFCPQSLSQAPTPTQEMNNSNMKNTFPHPGLDIQRRIAKLKLFARPNAGIPVGIPYTAPLRSQALG